MFGSKLKETRQRAADLRGELAQVNQQMTAIGTSAIGEKREMTDAERGEFMRLNAQKSKLLADQLENDGVLAQAEAANEAERRGEAVPDHDAIAQQQAMARAGIHSPHDPITGLARPASGPRAVQMFGAAVMADSGGWGSSGEFLFTVGRQLHDARMRADSQSGDIGSTGGFLIPGQLWGQMLDSSLENEIVRPRAQVFGMTTRELDVAALDDADRSGGDIAGIELQFAGEGQAGTAQVMKLRALRLRARKGLLFVECPNELLFDAQSFESNLGALLTKALSFGFDNRFLFGDGANGPLGALIAASCITINRQTANRILYDDLVSMFARLLPSSVNNSVWVANSSCIPQLAVLSVPVGTGGAPVAVMTESNGQFKILTRPVIFSEKAKNLGTQSDISLCDFSQYAVGLRREASLDRSQHVGFMSDKTTFRLVARMDGQPVASSVVTPLNGSTLSAFVTLGDVA